MITALSTFIQQKRTSTIVLQLALIGLVYTLFISWLLWVTTGPSYDTFTDWPLLNQIILIILIGPLLETFLFQYLPLEWKSSFTAFSQKRVILSVLLFALAHLPNQPQILYFILVLIMGLYFGAVYFLARQAKKECLLDCICHPCPHQ